VRSSRYRSLSLNPRRARPPATTRAIQLTHIGIDQSPMVTVHSMKIRTRWNRATTAKITPATRENVFASMSHHPRFLTQDSTQGAGGCERRANVITRRAAPPTPLAGLEATLRQVHRHSPHRRGSEGADRANSAEHRGAFRADETGRQKVTVRVTRRMPMQGRLRSLSQPSSSSILPRSWLGWGLHCRA